MTVELRPLGVKCNIQCHYCYQDNMRDAGNVPHSYDIALMKQAIEKVGGPFSLFGGEPLLVPLRDLEELWRWGFEKYGRNSVQTNGVLITDAHLDLFKRYKVGVGISVDGPDSMNDVRWAGTLERTRESTRRTHVAIEKLCAAGMHPSLIVTLHKANATTTHIPALAEWFRYIDSLGISSARLHALETESEAVKARYALSPVETVAAMEYFAKLEPQLSRLRFDVFRDMRQLLLGKDQDTTCVWNACDPYTTRAVQGVEGNGQRSNCGRTNKDGVDFVKGAQEGFERYIALYYTPQEDGGCAGCRFFLQCKGQCPGTSIDNDWRNRTQDCAVWMALLEYQESQLVAAGFEPVSLRPRLADLESFILRRWSTGRPAYLHEALAALDQGEPGNGQTEMGGHADIDHGDEHGDGHGDHMDES